jgi:ubiquinone/menaquinone biosynthesis C-methylase UbiE
MTALPFADGEADLFLSYSGLHMIHQPELAVGEIARCLKPGGTVIGTTFLAEGSRRGQKLFELGCLRGHSTPPTRENLSSWLTAAGISEVKIGPELGFAAFSGRKHPARE